MDGWAGGWGWGIAVWVGRGASRWLGWVGGESGDECVGVGGQWNGKWQAGQKIGM